MPNILILFCIIILLLLLLNLCVWNICRQNYFNTKRLRDLQDGVATSNSITNEIYHLIKV